jgi:class 3 adenylate cyclase
MRCSKCGSDNREGRKFCAKCGAPLTVACSKCGALNQPQEGFCGECGAGLVDTTAAKALEGTPVSSSAAGERRHLTVLFCDLVGSTEIAGQLDPEEWRDLVSGYHHIAAEAITRYGGHVAKYLGDGVMAYFGWPEAHENDAERAARAGLAIVERVSKLKQGPTKPTISVRVGIDSGTVVIGIGAGRDIEVFGETPNIAARVQSAAAPDSVLITAATHRLLSGLFVVEDAGSQQLKGVANRVELYRVLRPTGVRGRLATARELTPFVGREEELRLLLSRWERAREREGQLVLVVGEAGIGKSRLVAEFHDRIRDTPHIWMESAGEQFFENSPFHAFTEMLSQWLELQGDTNLEDRVNRLERALASAGLNPDEAAPLIVEMLQLPVLERYPAMTLTPEQRRRRLLATLTEWVFGAAKLQPVVMVVEDLHWLDPSTLEIEQLLAEQGPPIPLMLLYTARPEFHAQWPMRSHHTQITLNRLSAREVRTMVGKVASVKSLPDDTVATVVERTGGVPLFVEELTRAVLEGGDGQFTGRAIPVTLHDSLMARLDRLGPAREVAQVGAVIGNEFSYQLLQAVHTIDEGDLQNSLRSLTDAELLQVRGLAPDATYQFKHALIRDAAYEALLKSRRRQLHLSVARIIDENFPVIKETKPEVLARHWTEAGETEPAIQAWQKAGDQAVHQFACGEAEQHYRYALAELATLAETNERDARELTLQLALGSVVTATRGFSATATAEVYGRARKLAERAGDAKSLDIFFAEHSTAHTRGEDRRALVIADQMLVIASELATPKNLALAHNAQGLARQYLGDLAGARQHYLRALERYREVDFPDFRINPGVGSLSWGGLNEWMLGYPDQADRYNADATTMARRQNNPFDLALALNVDAQVQSLRGNLKQALENVAEMLTLSERSGFRLWSSIGKIQSAWLRAQLEEFGDAVELIREGLAELDAMEFYLARPRFLGYLADAQTHAGAIDEARITVEEAALPNPDSLLYRPEMLRQQGELRIKRQPKSQAELEFAANDFRQSIALARTMGAKSWELRGTTSLARLLAKQGRSDEARERLGAIYNWFTEGFDTVDLKDAKELLGKLSA